MKFKSYEVKFYRYYFIMLLIISLFFLIPGILLIIFQDAASETLWFFIFWTLLFLPFLLYYGVKLRYYSKLKPIYVQEVKLTKIEGSMMNRGRFIIEMEIDGQIRTIKTLAIFSISYLRPIVIDNFSTKKALVGYDRLNGVAIVLKVLD